MISLLSVMLICASMSNTLAQTLDPAKNFVVTIRTSIPWIDSFYDLSSQESFALDLNIRSEVYQQIFTTRFLVGKLKEVKLLDLYPLEGADGTNSTTILLRLDFNKPIHLAYIRELFSRITSSAQFRRVKTSYIRLFNIQYPNETAVETTTVVRQRSTVLPTNTTLTYSNSSSNWTNATLSLINSTSISNWTTANFSLVNSTSIGNWTNANSSLINSTTISNWTISQLNTTSSNNLTSSNWTEVNNVTTPTNANLANLDNVNVVLKPNVADTVQQRKISNWWPIYLTESPTDPEVEILSTLVYFTRRRTAIPTTKPSTVASTTAVPFLTTPTATLSVTTTTTATLPVTTTSSLTTLTPTANTVSTTQFQSSLSTTTSQVTTVSWPYSSNSTAVGLSVNSNATKTVEKSQSLTDTNIHNKTVRVADSTYKDSSTLLALEEEIRQIHINSTTEQAIKQLPTVAYDHVVEPEDFGDKYVTLPPPYDSKH